MDERQGQVVVAGNREEVGHVMGSAVIGRVRMEDGAGDFMRPIAVSGMPVVQGLAVDPSGNLAVVGSFSETVDLGGGPLHTSLFLTPFVARYSPEVLHLWSRSLEGAEGKDAFIASYSAPTDSALLLRLVR